MLMKSITVYINKLLNSNFNFNSLLASNVTKSFVPMELPAPRRNLIDLPENYLSLLSKADQYRCPNSVTKDSKSPALCLVCGTIVCSQVRYYSNLWGFGNS